MTNGVSFSGRRLAAASILLLAAAVGACSDDSNDNTPTLPKSTDYVGLLASTDGQTGPLNITFASPVAAPPAPQTATGPSFSSGAPINATGTLSLGGGASVPITGTIDAGELNMSGGGWTLTGTLLNGQITGTFSGPGGVTGSLAAVSSTEGSPAVAYCGSFSGVDNTDDSEDAGTFSVVLAGDLLLGTAVGDNGTIEDFTGTATPSSTAGTGDISIHYTVGEGVLDVTGTYNPSTTLGSYTTKVGSTIITEGEFFGTVCGAS